MTITYPLRLFFDCSTAHLSEDSRTYLDEQVARSIDQPLCWTAKTPFGWFVWADENPPDDVPSDLAAIMRRARHDAAEYILFDADAPESCDLPTFEWSR